MRTTSIKILSGALQSTGFVYLRNGKVLLDGDMADFISISGINGDELRSLLQLTHLGYLEQAPNVSKSVAAYEVTTEGKLYFETELDRARERAGI